MRRDVRIIAEAVRHHPSQYVREAANRILREYDASEQRKAARKAAAEASPRRRATPRHPAVARDDARKMAGKEERRARVAAIREAVFARAGGRCESSIMLDGGWVRCGREAVEMDHWHGGYGKRRTMESKETCWALCDIDHHNRQRNRPGVAFWNEAFGHHCEVHGYPFTPHYDARAAAKEQTR